MRIVAALILLALALTPTPAIAKTKPARRSESRSEPRSERRSETHSPVRKRPWNYCESCERDARGRIKRNLAARREFVREHPCPVTKATRGACPGFVVDHIVPLFRGGRDEASNMQWQSREEARRKDRVE